MGQKAAKRQRQSAREADASPAMQPDLQSAAVVMGPIVASNGQASAGDQAPERIHVERGVDVLNIVQESNATGGTAQIVREFISNSMDSSCSTIKFAPLPYPPAKAGFAVVDDGQGMSRPSGKVGPSLKKSVPLKDDPQDSDSAPLKDFGRQVCSLPC